MESLKNNGVGGEEGGGEPPTPPHTPQRENPHIPVKTEGGASLPPPPPPLDPLQQQTLQARVSEKEYVFLNGECVV